MSGSPDVPGRTMLAGAAPKSARSAIGTLLAVAVPPGLWFVHLNVSYLLVPPSCDAGHPWLFLAVTVTALAGMALPARESWRASKSADDPSVAFLGTFGLWFVALFSLATLLVGGSALIVGPCS